MNGEGLGERESHHTDGQRRTDYRMKRHAGAGEAMTISRTTGACTKTDWTKEAAEKKNLINWWWFMSGWVGAPGGGGAPG